MLLEVDVKHQSRWSKMPEMKRQELNDIYRRAADCGKRNLDAIVRDLFPDAVATGGYWLLSNMDKGGRGSMWIYRTGSKKGGWVDAGTPHTSRKSGDIIHLVAEKLYNGNTWDAVDYLINVWG